MKQINGIWLPDSDTHFEAHLHAGEEFEGRGTYQFHKIQLAVRATPTDRRSLAIDVGAHVGLWSRVLAREFAAVEAFEPVAELRECWDKNLEGYDNISLHPFAVSDVAGEVEFEIVGGNSGNSRVRPTVEAARGDRWANDHATAITLDGWDFGPIRVDLIKVDVEGWELAVVRGAERLIKSDQPVIVVEQKPGHAEAYGFGRRDAVDLLASWGAKIAWEKAGDVCMAW